MCICALEMDPDVCRSNWLRDYSQVVLFVDAFLPCLDCILLTDGRHCKSEEVPATGLLFITLTR